MAKSDELKNLRNRYRESLKNVQLTANAMAESIRALRSLIDVQSNCYCIDDIGGGSGYLNDLLETENAIYSNIVNNIIPGVQSKINNFDWKIKDALVKEAIEREGSV